MRTNSSFLDEHISLSRPTLFLNTCGPSTNYLNEILSQEMITKLLPLKFVFCPSTRQIPAVFKDYRNLGS
jgi:hypothetical protein